MDVIELTGDEERRRGDLVHKLKQGEINLAEAQELRTLLEKEKHSIAQEGNCLPFFAVTFLISYIDEYLESKNKSLLASET